MPPLGSVLEILAVVPSLAWLAEVLGMHDLFFVGSDKGSEITVSNQLWIKVEVVGGERVHCNEVYSIRVPLLEVADVLDRFRQHS